MPYQHTYSADKNELMLNIGLNSLDASIVHEFRKSLDVIMKNRPKRVTIDLQSVQFIDSSGIGALIGIQKKLAAGSEPIILLNTQPTVRKVIELLRLHRVFDLK